MTKTIHFIAIISLLIIGCKSTKGIKDDAKSEKINTTEIIKRHYKQQSNFNTLKASLKIIYKTFDDEESLVADLRLEKDKKIWISIKKYGIPGAKALITPNQVRYYNKIDKNYFDGDFSLINNWLGTDLTFQQLQAVLLGESMFPLSPTTYESELLDDAYLLKPETQAALFEHFITLNPSNYKVKAQEVAQPDSFRILNIDYTNYQNVSEQLLPLLMNIDIVEKTSETQIDIEYRNVSLNQELRYPFNIPKQYKEIIFE